jgi:predicted ArsR family transcriptional regulator
LRLGATKRRILEHLRLRKASAGELAGELGLSKVAIYRHLEDLEREGLVRVSTRSARGRGRPLRLFEAIDEPTAYARMCREMIEQIEELYGPGAGVRVLRARYRKEVETWKSSFRELEPLERVRRLAQWLTERGYQASALQQGTGLVLEQRRCPKLALARDYRPLCQVEMEFFSELLDVPLRRECAMSEGDACCRYRIELG